MVLLYHILNYNSATNLQGVGGLLDRKFLKNIFGDADGDPNLLPDPLSSMKKIIPYLLFSPEIKTVYITLS